jgi:hypothetical protein
VLNEQNKQQRKKIRSESNTEKLLIPFNFLSNFLSAAHWVQSVLPEEKNLMETMLSLQHTHRYTPNATRIVSKYFGCLFFEIKTLLKRLSEMQAMICLTSIVPPEKKRFHILLRSPRPSEEFGVLENSEAFSKETPTVVFEAVVKENSRELALQAIHQHGFSPIILALAANAPPYEPGSKYEEISDPAVKAEIARTPTIEKDLFTMDHVFLNCLGEELER